MGREVVGLTTEDDIDAIEELAEDVLFSHGLETALGHFDEEFRLCGAGPDTLMVRRRGTRAKPVDLLRRPEEILLPLLRDDLELALDVAAQLVAPMVDELRTRATRPLEDG